MYSERYLYLYIETQCGVYSERYIYIETQCGVYSESRAVHTHAPFPVGYVIQPQYVSYREGCVYACDRPDYATMCISHGGVTM